MSEKRGNFTSKLGFVLAAAGSAVGLGNIWRFPYLAAKYGGGIFLLVYIILAVTFGFTLMVGEIAIGRKTGLSAVGAFESFGKKYAFIGYIAAFVPAIILPYYSVIGGWVMKYAAIFVLGEQKTAANGSFFDVYISKSETIYWFLAFIAITAIIVFFGVEKGVEKVSKIMMPALIVLTLFIVIYTLFMPGALEGAKYYLLPDFSEFSYKTVLAALGQLFYSMSLAMGIMITYGSYMKKDVSIEKSVRQISLFDTGIAFLAGLMIVPAAFVQANGNLDAMKSGPGLMFITLPQVFDTMPGGRLIGVAFFIMVFFAALTSSISLMETVVSVIKDKFKINRLLSCIIAFAASIALGLISCFGYGIWANIKIIGMQFLDFFDFMTNSVTMPILAIITSVFIGFVIKPRTIIEEVELTEKFKAKNLFAIVIKYVAPVCIFLILLTSVLGAFKVGPFEL